MIDAVALAIFLHDRRAGTLLRLDGECSMSTFDDAYIADAERLRLSLAYRDTQGGLSIPANGMGGIKIVKLLSARNPMCRKMNLSR